MLTNKYLLAILVLIIPVFASCNREDIFAGADTSRALDDAELAWSAVSAEVTIGAADNVFPTLVNGNNLAVSYSSNNEAVATISSDGNVTLIAGGTVSITAQSSATKRFEAATATYTLTVNKGENGIGWSAPGCSVKIDAADNIFPTLTNAGGQKVSYSSSNANVAKIDSTGTITLVNQGEVTIVATAAENDAWQACSASYTLTVEGELASAGLSWSETTVNATLAAADNVYPTLINPHGLTVKYSSTDETVAKVDASSGTVTLVAAGTTAIVATSEANDTYAAGSASYTLRVVKQTVTMEWSTESFKAVLEDNNVFPTLSISPAGISVSYSSSNEGVATIAADGSITLVAVGSTTISAAFEGDDIYKAASAVYTLTVASRADEGAGTYTYGTTGDTSSDDDISLTTFNRMITVTYSGSTASVSGDYYGYASVSGAHVTVTNTKNDENIVYRLTGSTSDGSFKLYSSKKQAILLDGVSITNPAGAAINNQSGKRTFVMVEGSNTLADGSSAAYSATNEDMKGVFFSEGQLIFSGSGTLTVNANNAKEKSCIVSDDYVRIMNNPTLKLTTATSAGHGLKGKEYVRISGGTLNITSKAAKKKGITSEDYVLVEGGTSTITVTGGTAYDSEDSEYKTSAGIKADNYFGMTGGTVNITNSGSGGKGIRAGSYDYVTENEKAISDSYISGGSITIKTTGNESNDKKPKGIKIGYKESNSIKAGHLTVSGGNISINTTGSGAEGIESKGSLTFSGGKIEIVTSKDDCINAGGKITFSGAYVYAYTTGNDAIDSNYGSSGAIVVSDGIVFAHSKQSPEEAFDCDNHTYIQFKGGVVFGSGGLQGGGGSSSPSCSQPVHYIQSFSLSAGYFVVADASGSVVFSAYVPRALSQCYSFITSPSLSSGTKYYWTVQTSAPGTSGWGTYYYTGGNISISSTMQNSALYYWTAGSGFTYYGGSSGGGGGGRPPRPGQ